MKPSEIREGKTYRGRNGAGRKIDNKTAAHMAGFGDDMWYWRVDLTTGRTKGCGHIASRQAIARWAVAEVVPAAAEVRD